MTQSTIVQPFFRAGDWQHSPHTTTITCAYDDTPVGTVAIATAADVEHAIAAATETFAALRRTPAHQRAAVLRATSVALQEQRADFARLIALEACKPIKHARAEVDRAIFTFQWAAEEATRIAGDLLPMDAAPPGDGRQGIVRPVPIGPIAAITPFNFPLNLVAHKLAPAIAAGCPVVLKPAPQTPLTALKLATVLHHAGLPPGALSVLPLATADATPLVEDERLKMLSFTGSPGVGWHLKSRAGRKRVALELGGNAATIVHSDADLADAARRCALGGFAYAGQSCISVQRIFVEQHVYEAFLAHLVSAVAGLHVGAPLDEQTDLSALINTAAATRMTEWLAEARAAGARVLTGGTLTGTTMQPTILVDAPPHVRVVCAEVFAPLVTVQPYHHFDEALAAVNDSIFGLQVGLFTYDMRRIWHAYDTLEVGGVIVNDVPTWRVDHMPYGGVKQSGFGREGVRYAITEMTEPRLLVLNL